MPQSTPYQPALLRLLHGAAAVLVVLALITGFWVYDIFDKRWGSLGLPSLGDVQGIHGTIALTFLLLLPFFALYSFHIGDRRLLQQQTLDQLNQVGTPIWWIAVHRSINTLMLLAVTGAAVTGRMMTEGWLPAGDLNQRWYLAHLVSWLVVLLSLTLHLLLGAKVGGVPFLLSMFRWKRRSEDVPRSWLRGIQLKQTDAVLKLIEIAVIGGILLAFILPVFNL